MVRCFIIALLGLLVGIEVAYSKVRFGEVECFLGNSRVVVEYGSRKYAVIAPSTYDDSDCGTNTVSAAQTEQISPLAFQMLLSNHLGTMISSHGEEVSGSKS